MNAPTASRIDQAQGQFKAVQSRTSRSHIESKFATPLTTVNLVSIPRLDQKFDSVLSRRLVCLNAPAGYGKTATLIRLHAFAASKSIKAGWISLDDDDNDPIRFFRFVTDAIQRAVPELNCSSFPQPGDTPTAEAIVLSLCNALAKIHNELALFLDDYHLIENETVHGAMNWLIERSPKNLMFCVATRKSLPLSLERLRAVGDFYELRSDDLGLHQEEARAFVTSMSGHSLTEKQVALLVARTEGWAAGLQFASLALRDTADANEFIDTFSGSDRDITTYLAEIVLSQLPSKTVEFLSQTALFDRFSESFCMEVLQESNAGAIIESIRNHNLFLIPLDRENQWFRYHHLFADYLKNRFTLSEHSRAMALYKAASEWSERNGAINDAIRYAFAAEDQGRAADLIEACVFERIMLRGEHTTLMNWVSALPKSQLEKRPKIRMPYIWSLMHMHHYTEAEFEFHRFEKILDISAQRVMPPQEAVILDAITRQLRMMRCVFYTFTGQRQLAAQKSHEWLTRWEHCDKSSEVGTVLSVAGYSAFLANDYEQAIRSFIATKKCHEQAGAHYGVAWAEMLHSLVLLEQGNIHEAESVLISAHEVAAARIGPYSYGTALLVMLHSQVCYEQNRVDDAERMLDDVFVLMNGGSFGESSLNAFLVKARIQWLRGHPEEADSCLSQGAFEADKLGLRRMSLLLSAERIHLRLKSNQVEQALRIADSAGYAWDIDTDATTREQNDDIGIRVIEVRLKLATGRHADALPLLNDLTAAARRHGSNIWLVKLLGIKAEALALDGDRNGARLLIEEAMFNGAQGGLCRSLVDEIPHLHDLIQEITAADRTNTKWDEANRISHEYMVQLLHAFGNAYEKQRHSAPEKNFPPARKIMLSERELQILRLLSTGVNNMELAGQLFVSEATVKWHLRNIYAKLNVSNRAGAIVKARDLSLL